jgi:hypothetical protein
VELDVERVEDHPPDVVLLLVPGTVADPDRAGAPVPGQVIEGLLGQVAFPADAVHDLQLELPVQVTPADRIQDEAPVFDRFPVEAQAVQRAEHERRVPDPGEPVVPVAGPTPGFRQRGRRRGHDGARGGVAESLQGQRAAVEVGLPRVVGDLGRAQPVAPEIDRGVQRAERFLRAARNAALPPRQGDERRLALGERRAPITARTQHAERDTAGQFELQITLPRGDRHSVVPVTLVTPCPAGSPVIEQRGTVHDGLDPAADARRDPDQRADRAEFSRSPVVIRPPSLALDRAHGQEVLNGHPSRRRLPGRLQHHRPWHIPAVLGHLDIAGTEPERASGPVQQRPEHTRGVGAWQAQPLDRPVRRHQAALLAIGQESIVGDRRKHAHRCFSFGSQG